ncbi:TPA: fimbrial protein [Citrobacter freundii]
MSNDYSKWIIKVCAVFLIFALELGFMECAWSTIQGAYGVKYSSSEPVSCDTGSVPRLDKGSYFKGGACTLNASGYVPASGQYRVKTVMTGVPEVASTYAYFDSSKNLTLQNITVSGSDVAINITSEYMIHICYVLSDTAGKEWALFNDGRSCNDFDPIPPNPPEPDTACTINSGNSLDVEFGTIDRAKLPTVAGSGEMKSVPVNVNCTGGNVTVNMQLDYNPISVGESKVAISSTNGLGVAIAYNNKVLSTTDITPVTFQVGNNTLTLAFQAVRDPNVAEGDVPVGYFTSTATLVMTQQ